MAKLRRASHGKSKAKHLGSKIPAAISKVINRSTSQAKAKLNSKSIPKDNAVTKPHAVPAQQQKLIDLPLDRDSKILLIGEGDFSFSASLAAHHGCENLTATTFESPATLQRKHPETSKENTSAVTSASGKNKILYSVDGTKLGLPSIPGGAELRKQIGTFDTAWFNFPHVGGKSTDVNRQVRANQALVVGFLEGAKRMVKSGGDIVVSLFEGMPYELWGIRNLARHVGLKVERSGAFEWERFPGYSHARTLGDVEGGGGWKGEERAARIYVFRKEGGEATLNAKKRRRDSSEDDEDEDEVD